jgi:hypothetical protein
MDYEVSGAEAAAERDRNAQIIFVMSVFDDDLYLSLWDPLK